MTYFIVRSTEAGCDKPGSGQPILQARFHPNIFRIKIGIVASVTQEMLGLVSCSHCRPQSTRQICVCLQSTLMNCEARQWIKILYFWELLNVSSAWTFSFLNYDVKKHVELRYNPESSAVCWLVKYSAFWFGRRIVRSGGQWYRQLRGGGSTTSFEKVGLMKEMVYWSVDLGETEAELEAIKEDRLR